MEFRASPKVGEAASHSESLRSGWGEDRIGALSLLLPETRAPHLRSDLVQIALCDYKALVHDGLGDFLTVPQIRDGLHGSHAFKRKILSAIGIQIAVDHHFVGRSVAVKAA